MGGQLTPKPNVRYLTVLINSFLYFGDRRYIWQITNQTTRKKMTQVQQAYKDYFRELEREHPVWFARFKQDYGNYL